MSFAEIDLGLPHVATFPCAADKKPITAHGFHDAIRGMVWRKAPLVGFPTGAVNGVDVLDIDGDAGCAWYDANFDAIPLTQAHSTQRGMHLLFVHAPDLQCSTSKIAPGVDVRANGGYAIWWPREGLPVEDHPVSEWPDWLLAEARAACAKGRTPQTRKPRQPTPSHVGVEAAGVADALRQMSPVDWRGDFERWFALLGACKAVGIAREVFVEWSVGDVEYLARRGEIERIWECALGAHGGALYAALAERSIKLPSATKVERLGGPSPSPAPLPSQPTPTIDLRARTDGLFAHLAASPTDDRLFTVAATFGEIILEGRIQRWVANDLLEGACKANGLWRSLGPDRCKRTIANAYRHVEEKYLGERE